MGKLYGIQISFSINDILLEHSHGHSFIYCLWLFFFLEFPTCFILVSNIISNDRSNSGKYITLNTSEKKLILSSMSCTPSSEHENRE